MSVINLQQNIHNCQETIYNLLMPFFDAESFAERLRSMFRESRFKSHSQLADESGLTRSAVSSLMSAKPQTATNKPSQPRPETVIKLAKSFGIDPDDLLQLAGYAPIGNRSTKQPKNVPEFINALAEIGIEIDFAVFGEKPLDSWNSDDLADLKEQIASDVGVKIRRKNNQ